MGAGTSLISSGSGATVTTAMAVVMYLEGKKMEEEANELAKSEAAQRPIYGIPESVQKSLSLQERQALVGMPEDQRKRYLDQIARSQAYAISGGVDRGYGLQGIAQANMAMNDANANLLTIDNQQRQQNINNYIQGLNNYGAYEDKAFAYNKDQPYQDMAAAIRALKGAGEQAKYAGAQTVANAGSNFAGQAGTALNTVDTTGNTNRQQQQSFTPTYYNQGYQGYNPYGGTYNTSPPQPQAQPVYQYQVAPNQQTTPDPYATGYGTPYTR
jgi:hypothetical protein